MAGAGTGDIGLRLRARGRFRRGFRLAEREHLLRLRGLDHKLRHHRGGRDRQRERQPGNQRQAPDLQRRHPDQFRLGQPVRRDRILHRDAEPVREHPDGLKWRLPLQLQGLRRPGHQPEHCIGDVGQHRLLGGRNPDTPGRRPGPKQRDLPWKDRRHLHLQCRRHHHRQQDTRQRPGRDEHPVLLRDPQAPR
jgi:hypothetical protein